MAADTVSIANGALRCTIALDGAELRSLMDVMAGEEFIWQRDADIWPDSAPILFPVVGRLKDGAYLHEGRRYRLPIHGFARAMRFKIVDQKSDLVSLMLREDDNTLACYPFSFSLLVRFAIEDCCLNVSYQVRNTGSAPMPFSLGSHPGFQLPPSPRGPRDWSLLFSEAEEGCVHRLKGDLLDTDSEPLALVDGCRLPLSPTLFDGDALIFKRLRSRHVRLVHRSGRVRLSVTTGGAPSLGIWSKPNAPYICIEPWHGYDDNIEGGGELAAKPGIIRLAPQTAFATGYAICVPPSAPR